MKLPYFKIVAILLIPICCVYYMAAMKEEQPTVIFTERPCAVSYPVERLVYEIYYTPSFLNSENALYYSELLIYNALRLQVPGDIVKAMHDLARSERSFAAVVSFGQTDNVISASGVETQNIYQLLNKHSFHGFSLAEIIYKNSQQETDSQIGKDAADNKITANLKEWEKAGNFQIPAFVVSLAVVRTDTEVLWNNSKKIPPQYDVRPYCRTGESYPEWTYVVKEICRKYSADFEEGQAELNLSDAPEYGENYYKLQMPVPVIENLRHVVSQLQKNQRALLIVNGIMVDIESVMDCYLIFRIRMDDATV